jgi:hypothetical protein
MEYGMVSKPAADCPIRAFSRPMILTKTRFFEVVLAGTLTRRDQALLVAS